MMFATRPKVSPFVAVSALLAGARRKTTLALTAHRCGRPEDRDAYLTQAAELYRRAGNPAMVAWCERFRHTGEIPDGPRAGRDA